MSRTRTILSTRGLLIVIAFAGCAPQSHAQPGPAAGDAGTSRRADASAPGDAARRDAALPPHADGGLFPHGDAGGFRRPDASVLPRPDAGMFPRGDAGGVPRTDAALLPITVGAADVDLPSAIDAGVRRPRGAARADAGMADAAASEDAGTDPDAGIPDAAAELDAGLVDAGVDAGLDVEEEEIVEAERAVEAPVVEAPPEGPPASAESTVFAIKLIFGLTVLLALAYLGGHRRVLRLQEKIGIRGVILAGFPFLALGVVASLPSVGILTDDVIPKLRPVLQFGLGWIGFIIGAQLDIRVLDRLPTGSAYLILIEALAPFLVTASVCGAVMIGVFGLSLADMAAWRDIVLLGAAAAMTAPRKFHGFANRSWYEGRSADVLLGQLDEIVGVIGLLFIMAYFRDDTTSAWQLPRTAWLFVTVGLGVVLGVLIYATIRVPRSNAEFLAIVLGSLAFASGLASVLRVSPIVVCFLAGALVTNFPNEQRASVFRILNHLEHALHLLFLMIAGALWSIFDWRGWALVPLFIACRMVGKWIGVGMTRVSLGSVLPPEFTHGRRLVVPMSTMAIALVVSIERFRDVGLNWVVTAVIGSAIVTELIVSMRDHDDDEPPVTRGPSPIDELDDLATSDRGPRPSADHKDGPT